MLFVINHKYFITNKKKYIPYDKYNNIKQNTDTDQNIVVLKDVQLQWITVLYAVALLSSLWILSGKTMKQ